MSDNLTTIICSKHRPLQLYALLESFTEKTDFSPSNTFVVYRADGIYDSAYDEIKQKFEDIKFVYEVNFRNDVLDILSKSNKQYAMFLMDDDVFLHDTSLKEAVNYLDENSSLFTFSLRLGKNLNYCYPVNSNQAVPFGYDDDQYFMWNYKEGEYDWNYPLSLDGHIFERAKLLKMMEQIKWWSPNSLEAELQTFNLFIDPMCVCYQQSKLFNMPMNRVQEDFKNRCGQTSAEDLFDLWKQDLKIDLSKLYGFVNKGAHEETRIYYTKR